MQNLFKDDYQTGYVETKVQNYLPTKAPDFCGRPFWFVNGGEKVVKIGRKCFNYMDYLEAYCNIDCGTYRSRDALEMIYRKIQEAFDTINNVK